MYKNKESLNNAIKVIDRWLRFKTYALRIPGISIAIVHDKEMIFSNGYGYSDLAHKTKTTDQTAYRIASISKTFTAVAIIQLVEQGKINLDDKVAQHLPWFQSNNDKNLEKITIRQLLSHSSGVNRDGNTPHWENENFPSVTQLKKQVAEGISLYKPIERFKYSNLGYAILGQVIETITAGSYDDYIETNIIKKLDLSHTSVEVTDKTKTLLATGYGIDMPEKDREVFQPMISEAMAPAAGLVSNAQDLCRYMSAQFMGNTELLSDDSKREMQRIQWVRGDENIHYGLGYEILKEKDKQLYGHGGGFLGYSTYIRMDAENKLGVALLTNATGTGVLWLMTSLYHTLHYFLNQKTQQSTQDLTKYEGQFRGRWGETAVVAIGDALFAYSLRDSKPMEYPQELESVGTDTFKITTGDDFDYIGETVRYEFDKKGKIKTVYFGPNPQKPFEIKV